MVTGVIVAENNNEGIIGVAHTSKVFPIRMARSAKSTLGPINPNNIQDNIDVWISNEGWIIRALKAAYDSNCVIVNGSFVSIQSQAFDSVLSILATYGRGGKGIPLVFAAGNRATGCIGCEESNTDEFWGHHVRFPALSSYTIGVGGATSYGPLENTFNHGKGLDLIAPGIGIKTTFPPSANSGVYYGKTSGTSFSSPLVAGTIALMLSIKSELTYSQIKEILFSSLIIPLNDIYYTNAATGTYLDTIPINTTIPNYPYGDWNICYGYGFLNTHAAVVNTVFYGESVDGNNTINLCDEAIYTLSEFDLPEWVDEVYWSVSDNLTIIEEISPLSIRVKAIGAGNGTVTYNIVHNNYTKKINKVVVITSIDNISYNSQEFEGVQSINTNSIISGVNIVKPNCILTISSQIQCTPNASFIINPGGKLIINNGSLTNYCEDFPWQGIVIEGDPNSSQVGFNPNQGILTMNNSSISNAVCGIKVGDFGRNPLSGGIVTLSNSSFTNNKISLYLAPYKNIFNNGILKNRSSITNCNFNSNNDFFIEQSYFFTHVYLNGVNGVSFNGCTFNSSLSLSQNIPFFISYPNTGIRSFNSGFKVGPNCNSSLYLGEICPDEDILSNSIFTGLDYGIVASSGGDYNLIEINSTQFSNNDYGIFISGVNNPKILKNIFSIGKDSNNITSRPTGLYLKNSTGFRIEENVFNDNSLCSLEKIGLTIKNNKEDNNIVYKNKFNHLTIGQQFLGHNYKNLSANDESEGLVSVCNENELNQLSDIRIESIESEKYAGINPFQSYLIKIDNEYVKSGANNLFTDPEDIVLQYSNEGIFINYYYNNYEPLFEPTEYYAIQPIEALYENSCPSKISGLYPAIINSELSDISLSYGNLKYNYNQLIDAGNTHALIDLIQGEWSDDVWELRTELLSKSPYLSQEALYSVALKNLLPPALFLEICLANPDATKSEEFLEKLRTVIPNPLPEYMINLIRASWNQKTLRTELEEELSAFKTYRDEYQNYKTEILFSDTIYNYTDIINHLGSRGSYGDYFSLAEIALSQDNFEQANLYLDILEYNTEKLSSEEVAEISSFREYILFRESILLDSTTIYNLDSTQIAALEIYASSNNYRGAILARNILCFLYHICIDDVPAPPKMLRVGSTSNAGKNTTPYIASVKVLPNPANTYVSFIWDMKSYNQPAILYIYDQTGKTVITKEIENPQGQWIWDLKNTPTGVYVYTLKSDQLILFSGKVIVNK